MQELTIDYNVKISRLCTFFNLPRSTYYYKSVDKDEEKISVIVEAEFSDSERSYGARRIKDGVKDKHNIVISRRKVRKIMIAKGLISKYTIKKRRYKSPKAAKYELPNLINGKFDGYKPNEVVVGDATYLNMLGKTYFLCILLDLCGRYVIGYAVSDRLNKKLVRAAFESVEGDLRDICIFHYDRGSESANEEIDRLLAGFDIKRSFSSPGKPTDNAPMESWFHIFKTEFFYTTKFTDIDDFMSKLSVYIKRYNEVRPMPSLGKMSPKAYREKNDRGIKKCN